MKRIFFPIWLIVTCFFGTVLLSFSASYGEEVKTGELEKVETKQVVSDESKPQTLCPLTGGEISKKAFVDYKGQRVYLCCMGCEARFLKNPEKPLKKIQENGEKTEMLDPVTVQPNCPVSDDAIDPAMFFDHNGKRIYFCCEKCKAKFLKKPEKFLKKMEKK